MWGCSVGGGHATRFDWEDESTVKLFQRTVEKSEYEGLDPQGAQMVEDRDDEKDTGGYSEAKNPATNGPKEMEQNLEDTSNVNNGHSDDYQACAADVTNTSKSVSEQNQVDMDSSEKAKVLKKPDKILPCPRCNSLDTKFCYYNNYNVNQPRYFCRSCQRYWTAGGTMRNVPVGAGRRKSKHSASHCQQLLTSSNEMPTSELNARDSIYGQVHPSEHLPIHMRPSMVDGAVLKLVEEENASHLGNQMQNGDPLAHGEYAEEISVSYEEASQFIENKIPEKLNQVGEDVNPGPSNGFMPMPPLQCFPAPLWPYMWNPLYSNDAPAASGHCMYPQANHLPNSFPWNPPPMVGMCVPPIPFPLIQASAGSCISSWPTGPWAMPWHGPNFLPPPPCTNDYAIPKNKSPRSRKHSRVVDIQGKEKAEKSLWIPKTLRIDDPDEAAKSSIWATLGIRPDLSETGAKDRIFKGFHSNTGDKDLSPDAKNVLHANPAALSRSQAFQEST